MKILYYSSNKFHQILINLYETFKELGNNFTITQSMLKNLIFYYFSLQFSAKYVYVKIQQKASKETPTQKLFDKYEQVNHNFADSF